MNRIHLILLSIMFISCSKSDDRNIESINKKVSDVVNVFIEDKSLYKHGFIFDKVVPYEYYEIKYTSDGVEIPTSDFSYALKNEQELLQIINSKKYFDPTKNAINLKAQLLQSNNTFSKVSLNLAYLKGRSNENKDSLTSYTIYPPLFNSDSTAAYIQYDFFDYGWEEGMGSVYVKRDEEWRFLKNVSSHIM